MKPLVNRAWTGQVGADDYLSHVWLIKGWSLQHEVETRLVFAFRECTILLHARTGIWEEANNRNTE